MKGTRNNSSSSILGNAGRSAVVLTAAIRQDVHGGVEIIRFVDGLPNTNTSRAPPALPTTARSAETAKSSITSDPLAH
jgi:hypothetical protein